MASSKTKMNRKLLSVFFSALVCSTLGHEHLRAHELQRHHARSQSLGSHHARANDQQCSYICPVPNPSPEMVKPNEALSLVFIKESKVFALVNTVIEVAIIFQIGEPIALLANGKTGVSVVINIDKETVVHFPAGSNDNLWKYSQSSLVEYLQKLGPLTNVNNWKNGQSFKLKTVTKEVKNIVISIIETLEFQIGKIAKKNPDAVISLISVLIKTLQESSDVVELLLVKLESTLTVIVGGLAKVVNLIAGLKIIGKKLNGGIQSLLKNDINVSLLLAQNSGLSSLINLLIQIGVHLDLTKILGDLLKSPESLLELAVTLDGGIYVGVAGITAVIYNVQLYAAKKISLDALIDILIQVQANNDHVKITKEVWDNLLNWYFTLAKSQTSQFNTGSSWSTLTKFFQDIKDEKLIVNGINVSAIINVLITTSGNVSLSNLVKILVNLKPVVALTKIIATLYFRLIYFVISGQGLIYIEALLPDITITIDFSSSTGILKQILAKVNVLQIVSYLLRLDIIGAITHLPVLGPILNALDEILKALGLAVEVTVTSALKAVGSILDDLKDILLFGLGRGGKAPSDAGIAGLSILGGGISVSVTTSWTSTQKWSSSNSNTAGTSGSTSQSQGTTSGSTSQSQGTSGSTSQSQGTSGSTSQSQRTTVAPSSSTGGSQGGSGSHSGGISVGGGASGSGGSSSGGSGTHSGGISVGGGSSSAGGTSSGGSGTGSGGVSVGGAADNSGGSSVGGSGSHSGGISVGGSASGSGNGQSSSGGSASHSGGISVGGSAGSKGSAGNGWSLGNILGGGSVSGSGSGTTRRWSLF